MGQLLVSPLETNGTQVVPETAVPGQVLVNAETGQVALNVRYDSLVDSASTNATLWRVRSWKLGGPNVLIRWAAGLISVLLGSWGFYGAYQTVRTYYHARFIDVLPRFSLLEEVGNWSAVIALLTGAFFLCRFAVRPSRLNEAGRNAKS